MDVLTLSSTYFTGVSTNYPYDASINVKTQNYTTYENVNISVVDGLSSVRDTSNNYYTNFILTNRTDINKTINIVTPETEYPFSILSYLGLYTSGEILPESIVIQTTNTNLSAIAYPLTFGQYSLNLIYQNYTINFIDYEFCTITQNINNTNYYFSYFQCNTGSGQFLMVNSYQNDDVNKFNYVFDTLQRQLVLYKIIDGKQKYVTYDVSNNWLTVSEFLSGAEIFNPACAFKIRDIDIFNKNLPCDWYSYVKIIDVDNLNVDNERSIDNVELNYIFNLTNEKITNNALPLNILPLKNDRDDKNNLSRGNIINENTDGVIQRDYTSLNTGTNQVKGSVDFNNTYNTTTTQLLIKGDNLTFFYFPYEPFPVIKLNINDSSLVNSGCVAGDSPINADKVFKHKVIEYFAETFNNNDSETTGTYLCSWLKGGTSLSSKPVWVDRYYNPSLISGINALSFSLSSNYVTDFTQTITQNNINPQYPVYDVLSNLTFEPGIQYAIQHLGSKNIIQLIDSLSANVVQKYFTPIYDNLNQPYDNLSNEVLLGKKYYTKFLDKSQIAQIKEFNNFTINFDLYSNDWSKPLGYQIFGNYNYHGFGIFNYQRVTPFVVTNNNSTIFYYNTDLTLLDSVSFSDATIKYFNNLDPVGNTVVITNDNYISVVNYNSVIINKKLIPNLAQYSQYYSTLEYTYCWSSTLPVIEINNSTLEYTPLSTTLVSVPNNNILTNIYTVISYNNTIYTVPGKNIKCNNDKIYFLITNSQSQNLCCYDIIKQSTIVIYQCAVINDYIINDDDTLYVVFDNNKLLLSDEYYRIQNSNGFPFRLFANQPTLSSCTVQSIDYISNFDNTGVVDEGIVFGLYNPTTVETILVRTSKITNNTVTILQTVSNSNPSGICNTNLTNYNFTQANLYKSGTFEFRLGIPNVYNTADLLFVRHAIDVSVLEPGYHNFVIRFDSVNGVYSIFIDGSEVRQTLFDGGKYTFSNVIDTPFMGGNCLYYNNKTLGDYILKPDYYFTTPLSFKNFYLYNTALSYYNLLLHLKQNYPISDVRFQIPTGKRNFVETIQQFFMFKVPGVKSNYFNVNVVNLPVSAGLKEILNTSFVDVINKNKPTYTELNNINYHE